MHEEWLTTICFHDICRVAVQRPWTELCQGFACACKAAVCAFVLVLLVYTGMGLFKRDLQRMLIHKLPWAVLEHSYAPSCARARRLWLADSNQNGARSMFYCNLICFIKKEGQLFSLWLSNSIDIRLTSLLLLNFRTKGCTLADYALLTCKPQGIASLNLIVLQVTGILDILQKNSLFCSCYCCKKPWTRQVATGQRSTDGGWHTGRAF